MNQLTKTIKGRDLVDKSRFMVPNLITLGSMGLGLASMFFAIRGVYETAGWLIMFSVIFDKFDGSSARLFRATSEFGTQLDSFSDFVAFGIAPSVLVYSVLSGIPAMGMESGDLAYFYVSLLWLVFATALRLARFNISNSGRCSFMFGLPSTVGGALVALFVLVGLKHYQDIPFFVQWLKVLPALLLIVGALEVSTLKLPKVAKRRSILLNILQVAGFITLLVLVLLRTMPEVLLLLGSSYLVIAFLYCMVRQEQVNAQIQAECGEDVPAEMMEDNSL